MTRSNRSAHYRQPRAKAHLGPELTKNLIGYAAAAGAALFAMSQPAEAKIVYTPTNTVIGPDSTLPLDLNNDGIPDFTFKRYFLAHSSYLGVNAGAGNAIRAANTYAAAAGFFGVPIGPQQKFLEGSAFMAINGGYGGISSSAGPWAGVTNRYLGLKFVVGGITHFGWARLSVGNLIAGGTAVLNGYAYETIPNRRIKGGQTFEPPSAKDAVKAEVLSPTARRAGLDLLAVGAPGLTVWRREDEITA